MPNIVMEILIVIVSSAVLVLGLCMMIWPVATARLLEKFGEGETPGQSRWNVRCIGAVLVFLGLAGLHLVLVEGLKPFPPGEAPLGF